MCCKESSIIDAVVIFRNEAENLEGTIVDKVKVGYYYSNVDHYVIVATNTKKIYIINPRDIEKLVLTN